MTSEDKRKTDAAPTGQVYTLKITPLHARGVHRIVELLGSHSLAALHSLIEDEFALEGGAPWAFYLSDDPNDPGYGPHQQNPQRTARARLSTIGLKTQRTFLHASDHTHDPLQARRHQIQVLGAGPASKPEDEYPRVIESVGAAPPPPGEEPVPELAADLKPLAQEIAAAVARFEEAEAEEEGRERAEVQADAALLLKMARAVAGRPEQVRAIGHAMDTELFDWISDLPFALADHGLAQEAEALCKEVAAVCYPATLLGARAAILARLGRKDEALAQVRHNLNRATEEAKAEGAPVDLEVLDEAAEVLVELGELVQAEALTRQVLTALEERFTQRQAALDADQGEAGEVGDDEEDEYENDALLYGDALQRLSQILRRCGRAQEAKQVDALLREHADRMKELMELSEDADLFGDNGFPVPPELMDAFMDLAPERPSPAKKKGK